MNKPPLEKVIEKLKEADVREWETTIIPPNISYDFELKRCSLIFRIGKDPESSIGYVLSIEDHDKNVHITYEKEFGVEKKEMRNFYDELSKKIKEYREKETSEKLNFLLPESGIKEPDLKHIIARLKELDIQTWKPNKFFDKKCPGLTTEVSGITFCISKGLISGYGLEIKYGKEPDNKIKLDYTKPDKKYARKLIGELYEKVYKELKDTKEKEFKEKLDSFLPD